MRTAVDALLSLGGEARTSELLARTTYRALCAAVEAGSIVKLARGRYGMPDQPPAKVAAHAHNAVISHQSAAEHWDLPVLSRPDVPHLTLPHHRKVRVGPPARMHWADLPSADRRRRVTSPHRTVLDCARTLPFAEGLAIADGAVRARLVTPELLRRLTANLRGSGSGTARRVAAAVDGRAESCLESVLRASLIEAGIAGFQPQVVIDGRFRTDLANRLAGVVLEAEGFEFHGSRAGLVRDCRRYDELVALGWRVLRFSYEQIVGEPGWVVDVILRTLSERTVSSSARGPATLAG